MSDERIRGEDLKAARVLTHPGPTKKSENLALVPLTPEERLALWRQRYYAAQQNARVLRTELS